MGDLAHIGGFAAHVGTGQEHEAVFVVEAGVVGGEVAHFVARRQDGGRFRYG